MKKLLLAAAATIVIATPAAARDGSIYAGIEGGVLFPRDNDADADVDFTTVNATVPPGGVLPPDIPAGPADTRFENIFGLDYKTGYDIDAILGYDFGMFRIEGELGYKRASVNDFEIDDSDIAALNAALNRPSVAPDPGAPGLPALSANDFDLNGHVSVWSGMLNGLLDFGPDDGLNGYVGAGFGRANVKTFGDSDSAWAWQLIAGVRYPISSMIDIGLKYRYFQTGNVHLGEDAAFAFAGNPNRLAVGPNLIPVDQTTSAVIDTDFENKFRSHSLLASLIFNFGAPAAPPPPPPPVVAAPPPPATQTCPDGSVILATDACPAPPPPPPPPAPVERGERGQ